MKLLKAVAPAWFVLVAYAAFMLWARTKLPEAPIAVHFDVHMHPDRYAPRDAALFHPLLVMAGILALLTLAPFMLPPRGALERSARAYGVVCFAVAACLCLVLSGIAFQALRWPIAFPQLLAVSLGLMFMVIGNFMTKIRPNFIYGVRTPWTLANEGVWDKTHRFAGPAMVLGGLFVLVAGLVAPAWIAPIVLVGALVPGLGSVAYSYWLWSKLPPQDKRRVRLGA